MWWPRFPELRPEDKTLNLQVKLSQELGPEGSTRSKHHEMLRSNILRTAASATQKLQRAAFSHIQGAPQSRLAMNASIVFSSRSKSSKSKSSSFRGPIQNSVDETWEERRDIVRTEAWMSIIPERSSFQSSVDDTWQQRRDVLEADFWVDRVDRAVTSEDRTQNSVDRNENSMDRAENWASKNLPKH